MRPAKGLNGGTRAALLAWAAAVLLAHGAQAAVTISSDATQNMSCSGGICSPTANKAVLNVGDLEGLLASRNATVTTTGQGVQARDIDIKTGVAWSSSSVLTLEAHRSIAIDQPVSISGLSGLVVQTGGKNGTFSFGSVGSVTFANLSSQLVINGSAYALAGDLKTLIADVASNPSGNYALANNYDSSGDGTYRSPPIGIFSGTFEGLGNNISNLSIDGGAQVEGGTFEGLFTEIDTNGMARNFGLVNANILVPATVNGGAAFVGWNLGTLRSCSATGAVAAVRGKHVGPFLGGLVRFNYGTIAYSHAAVTVSTKQSWAGGLVGISESAINAAVISESYATGAISGPGAGGLVGDNDGTIAGSYATGHVRATAYKSNTPEGGGLIGLNQAAVTNSYATGAVSGGDGSVLGGLTAANSGTASYSYSTGSVSGGTGSVVGGLIGYDGSSAGSLDGTYWDTDTSGITNLSQGAGNIANDPGITGLTTAQFQSGLPAGFDPAVWAERSYIDDGFPYLLANPPRK